MSKSVKALSPAISVFPVAFVSFMIPCNNFIPFSKVRRKALSSSCITFMMSFCCAGSSGKASPISSTRVGTNLYMKASFCPRKVYPYLTARLKILLMTYPAFALLGSCPSAMAKAIARRWSTITRRATSFSSDSPY